MTTQTKTTFNLCRCCWKPLAFLEFMDGHPIHTQCIPKHWARHAHGLNASRCHEFRGGK